MTVNANLGYRTTRWEGVLECLHLLDWKDRDVEYYYYSQLMGETAPADDIHFLPAEPRMFHARVTYKF